MLFLIGSYCECFAGTTFCSDSCTCENCSNKDDYVEDVDKARNKLLAHNPLAFGPKVVSSDTLTDIKVVPKGNLSFYVFP